MIGLRVFGFLCFSVSATAVSNKGEFCSSDVCTMDMIPHCMTDGSMVHGCSELKTAICEHNKTENKDWDPSYICRDEDFCTSPICTLDLIPHCMSDGSIVRGCGDLKIAECQNNLKEQSGWTPAIICRDEGFCNSEICTMDYIPHCMNDGTIVHGCGEHKVAECQQGLKEQSGWTPEISCLPEGYCENQICTADYIEHCMTDGTTVFGCDQLKHALCQEGKRENEGWAPGSDCTPVQ